jgi:uncharacterized protein with PQ loop repeat
MLEFFGWFGGFLLAFCGTPQAWKSYKDGHSEGLSWTFLWMWFWGESLVLVYVAPQYLWPLILNYLFNIFLAGVILWYKFYPRQSNIA